MNSVDSVSLENISKTDDIIKLIDKSAVHRICSGQVILSLASAVKELVENSLDAGATSIEIRLKEYGQELIEVYDNGCGVSESNFSGLALKYCTSKLREFSDLLGISTFGFRGEALSSLCALSEVTIITRHSSADYGTKILYDSKGIIKEQTLCARQIGTTVSLGKLFYPLPVRQKEFHRNIKREFSKMTNLLYAYCLVSEGVKITCSNQTVKGSKSTIISTQGGKIIDNIACVFGTKQLKSILKLKLIMPNNTKNIKEKFFNDLENAKSQCSSIIENIDIDDLKPDYDLELSEESSNDIDCESSKPILKEDTNLKQLKSHTASESKSVNKMKNVPVEFDGFISTCEHNTGRSTSDRQFYYINSRPCEPQKVIKVVNEIYKQYNSHQYPFVFLNLKVKQSSVDVNVTPDKRKVFLDKENIIIEIIKASLHDTFENVPSTMRIENIKNSVFVQESTKSEHCIVKNNSRVFSSFLNQFSLKETSTGKDEDEKQKDKFQSENKRKLETLDDYVKCKTIRSKSPETLASSNTFENVNTLSQIKTHCDTEVENLNLVVGKENPSEKLIENITLKSDMVEFIQCDSDVDILNEPKEVVFLGYSDHLPLSQVVPIEEVLENSKGYSKTGSKGNTCKANTPKLNEKANTKIFKNDISKDMSKRNCISIDVNIEKIKQFLKNDLSFQQSKDNYIDKVKFRSEINPVFNKKCEEELQKELSKDMFSQMKIIGQFNLGFIITQLHDDLFIIDQHASDEKYNFETLQKTTTLSNQKLVMYANHIKPQSLELTGSNERLLIDNLDIFDKNGFTFEIDPEAVPTKRIKLLTIPISKNCVFGKNDIEELLFMLKDGSSNEIFRPSRIQTMFASRACRKSVMIGTALSKSVMKKLVDHMGVIDHPWNCPHGRPTIRHLINLALSNNTI